MKIINQAQGKNWVAYHGDCVDVVRGLPTASVDYSVFSPPFASLYTYSNSDRDMGNARNHSEFYEHFGFLVRELMRVMRPGRLLSFHCMNLPTSKARDGHIGLTDFRGLLIRIFQGDDAASLYAAMTTLARRAGEASADGDVARSVKLLDMVSVMRADLMSHPGENGWIYHSEVCIWKNPVTSVQRTKALGLLHKQIRKDSAMCRQGLPDYLVTMRTPGENPAPVSHTNESFPVERWQRYASPVWASVASVDDEGFIKFEDPNEGNDDKNGIWPGDTLQRESARDEKDERHICPLQLEVIRRAVRLWTNPGDVVLTPFGGIGSEGYVAVQEGRRAVLAELKASYFAQLVKNMAEAAPETKKQLNWLESA